MAFNFNHQPHVSPNPPGIDLTGQTIIITGSNQGIGLEAARQLLIHQASTIILAVRSVSKGEAARTLLLSDPAINLFGKGKARRKEARALLLNAGIGQLNYELAPTGHEKVVQVSYLSNAVLALELLPLLRATARDTGKPLRLSFVGSIQHMNSSFAKKTSYIYGSSLFERMDDKNIYSGMTVYGDTKLLVAMSVKEFAGRVSSDEVVINNMCPGGVNTRMSDVLPTPARQLMNVYKSVYHRSVEVGGWIIVNALVIAGKQSHGRF